MQTGQNDNWDGGATCTRCEPIVREDFKFLKESESRNPTHAVRKTYNLANKHMTMRQQRQEQIPISEGVKHRKDQDTALDKTLSHR